ncbi:MAG: hypothetical protein ACO3PY_06175 [Pontimonas sp.]
MKEQLASLIETYAAARASGDGTLQRFATQQLSTFLQGVDVTRITPPENDTPTTEVTITDMGDA